MKKGLMESKTVNILIAVAILIVLLIILIQAGQKGNSIADTIKNFWRVFT